jgi:hypothetical protein
MSIAVLYIQAKQDGKPDDVITFGRCAHTPGVFEVTYKPNDLKTKYHFYLSLNECADYLYRTLKLITMDNSPFGYVQVTTRMTPSVIFQIPDLDDTNLRKVVEDTVISALRTCPRVLVDDE